ncbi:MAG: addiction module protein [Verrucomicrobiae bacterium]|nr:addiction module protein [Verrucomicrobiae bacterium]
MPRLFEVQAQADQLSPEEKAGLVSHLLASFTEAPLGPDDEELARRIEEMDSGEVKGLTHEEFLKAVGRG